MAVSEDKGPDEKKQRREIFRLLFGVASTVGVNMVASVSVGFAIGYWLLDMYIFPEVLSLNTFPLFTLVFLLIGIVAGFIYLFRVALRQKDDGDPEEGS